MIAHAIHRLPVVDEQEQLLGMITLYSPSKLDTNGVRAIVNRKIRLTQEHGIGREEHPLQGANDSRIVKILLRLAHH
jgi:CBS-domain-containing membrane protein